MCRCDLLEELLGGAQATALENLSPADLGNEVTWNPDKACTQCKYYLGRVVHARSWFELTYCLEVGT